MRQALLTIAFFMTVAVAAQEGQEHRFVKITHTSRVTVAVDSSGLEWYYDSERGEFVSEEEYLDADRPQGPADVDDMAPDEVILPPEIRCVDIRVGDIIEMFDEVVVGIDERIEGSITARNVIIKGLVTGNVVSYRTVTVESTGEVRGDVYAKEIIRERGGRILGKTNEIPIPEAIDIGMPRVTGIVPDFMGIIFTGFLIFICVITIALFPSHLNRIVTRIESGVVKSFFWGVLIWFSILPVFVLLLITIVGIPLAILVFPFVLLAAIVLGYVSATIYIGKLISPRFGWQDKSIYIKGIIGVIALALLRILSNFFSSVGAQGLDILLGVLYFILAIVAITVGVGATVSSKFGLRPKPAAPYSGEGPTPSGRGLVSPVIPPPPPKTGPLPPQVKAPPPPEPPPGPESGNATDDDENPSNK